MCKGAIDTGTTMLSAPSKALDVLFENLSKDCSNFLDFPDLVFVIDGKDYPISSKNYILTIENGGEDDPGIHSKEFNQCTLAFISIDLDPPEGPLWVLGDIFLSSFYTVFDRDKMSVGLATAKHHG